MRTLRMGAVGILQFDVTASRLKNEYNVECVYDASPINTVRWISAKNQVKLEEFKNKVFENLAEDGGGFLVYLASSRVNLQLTEERWPDITFSLVGYASRTFWEFISLARIEGRRMR